MMHSDLVDLELFSPLIRFLLNKIFSSIKYLLVTLMNSPLAGKYFLIPPEHSGPESSGSKDKKAYAMIAILLSGVFEMD